MFTLIKHAKIVEITNNKRAYKNFLHAIEKIAFIFVEVQKLQLKIISNYEKKLITFIDIFRHHMRMKKTRKEKTTIFNSTFVANENHKKSNDHAHSHSHSFAFSFKNKQQKQTFCLCEYKHSYENCYYFNEKMRLENWKSKSKVKIKIDEILKNSMKKKSIKKASFEKTKNVKRKMKTKTKIKKRKKKSIEIFVIIQINNVIEFFTIDFVFNYFFRSSWILNHDFDVHVVNKTMKQRFIKKRNCTNEFVLMSKMKSFFILIYDRMNINVNTFTKNMNMNFRNVNYVFDFMINIVTNNIFVDKKLHFDTTHDHFHRNDIFVVFVFKIKTHYVFENNKKFEKINNFAIIVRKKTTTEWY